jgi:cell division protein FtsL
MTGGAVGTLVAMRSRFKRVGLFERLFYVSSIIWFFIVTIELVHIY